MIYRQHWIKCSSFFIQKFHIDWFNIFTINIKIISVALFKIRCLFLNLLSLQTAVRGRSRFWLVFVLWGSILWHLSISTSSSFLDLYAMMFSIFFSHASHVSLGASFMSSTLHKKRSFPLQISSVIVTKSAGNCNGKLHYLCSATRRLFLWNLSSNSIDFADTSSAFKRPSSMVLNSVFKFFILFSTKGSTS